LARVRRTALILAGLLTAARADAWDKDVHVTIIEAARRMSPALQARLPDGQITAILKAAADGDPLDPVCATHRGKGGEREAWNRAAWYL
jgi:hypothetical protein